MFRRYNLLSLNNKNDTLSPGKFRLILETNESEKISDVTLKEDLLEILDESLVDEVDKVETNTVSTQVHWKDLCTSPEKLSSANVSSAKLSSARCLSSASFCEINLPSKYSISKKRDKRRSVPENWALADSIGIKSGQCEQHKTPIFEDNHHNYSGLSVPDSDVVDLEPDVSGLCNSYHVNESSNKERSSHNITANGFLANDDIYSGPLNADKTKLLMELDREQQIQSLDFQLKNYILVNAKGKAVGLDVSDGRVDGALHDPSGLSKMNGDLNIGNIGSNYNPETTDVKLPEGDSSWMSSDGTDVSNDDLFHGFSTPHTESAGNMNDIDGDASYSMILSDDSFQDESSHFYSASVHTHTTVQSRGDLEVRTEIVEDKKVSNDDAAYSEVSNGSAEEFKSIHRIGSVSDGSNINHDNTSLVENCNGYNHTHSNGNILNGYTSLYENIENCEEKPLQKLDYTLVVKHDAKHEEVVYPQYEENKHKIEALLNTSKTSRQSRNSDYMKRISRSSSQNQDYHHYTALNLDKESDKFNMIPDDNHEPIHESEILTSAIAPSRCRELSTSDDGIALPENHAVVIAIDFGTTFSGYAFAYTNSPNQILMMRKWDDRGIFNHKAPTSVLLTEAQTFHSFGFSARDNYHKLSAEEAKTWYYFEKFKMHLHHQELSIDMELTASNGRRMKALTVFSHALRFLRQHALRELADSTGVEVYTQPVRWVITVPALWRSPAKQFMRLAAYHAGIADEDHPQSLLIALEPEAASIYCRSLKVFELATTRPGSFYQLNLPSRTSMCVDDEEPACLIAPGSRYMVVDCGGGTVDITVHHVDGEDGRLSEIHHAAGGPYGAMGVDREFEALLGRIFGEDFIERFKVKHPVGWIDFLVYFESRKRAACPDSGTSNVYVPFTFNDFHDKFHKDKDVKMSVTKFGDKGIKMKSDGMIRLDLGTMKHLFKSSLMGIISTIKDILTNTECSGLTYMFLVGGFSESAILQHEIKKEFGCTLTVIVPQDVTLAVLKGAVMFGLDPSTINLRRSRLSYGVGVLKRFEQGVHPPRNLIHVDGIDWCNNAFEEYIAIGQPIMVGETIHRTYNPVRSGQRDIKIKFYATSKMGVVDITDASVQECGVISLVVGDDDSPQGEECDPQHEIEARMMFGETEIRVSAVEKSTGACVKASVDFLNYD